MKKSMLSLILVIDTLSICMSSDGTPPLTFIYKDAISSVEDSYIQRANIVVEDSNHLIPETPMPSTPIIEETVRRSSLISSGGMVLFCVDFWASPSAMDEFAQLKQGLDECALCEPYNAKYSFPTAGIVENCPDEESCILLFSQMTM